MAGARFTARMRYSSFFFLLAIAPVACRSASRPAVARYVVTDTPIKIGVGPGLCIAADPEDREGIWWWEPGATGCSSRSTGPGVFHAELAKVSQSAQGGPVALSFRLPIHSMQAPFVDLQLKIEDGGMRAVDAGAEVRVHRRNDLDVPAGAR